VALVMTNRTEMVTCYLGTLRAGLVAVPLNPRSTAGELARVLVDSGSRLVVADDRTAGLVRDAVAALRGDAAAPRVVVVGTPAVDGEATYGNLVAGAGPPTRLGVDDERLAVLLYTSGTSGQPRGAMLTHRALLANVEQNAAVEPPLLRSDDVVLGVLPLFHVYGLNAVLGGVLRQQARLVLLEGFDPEETLGVVQREGVTVLPVAPPVFGRWASVPDLRERLAGVRLVLSGSAPLAPSLVEQFTARTGLEVHEGYGLTEAAPVVTTTVPGARRKRGSVGTPLPGVELRLLDEHGRTPEGEDAGEVCVRGANLFSGWWPDGSGGPDADGWYATGDVGFLDADGDLFLVDRVKELVIVSGFNVYPSEVEDVVAEVEGVAEAAVIGTLDERTGEAVVAYVRPTPAAAGDPDALTSRVRQHCAERLAGFKQPAEVLVVDDLPHTATGKVAKGRLRAGRRTTGLLE
jgi:long-chain acyl-CoA synthetase